MTNKVVLAVLGPLILLLTLIASRKTTPLVNEEKSAACRFVLASLNGNEPIDEEIAQQQTSLQSLHRFHEAEPVARELVSTRERPFDYSVLGDVLIDQGKVREGAAAFRQQTRICQRQFSLVQMKTRPRIRALTCGPGRAYNTCVALSNDT